MPITINDQDAVQLELPASPRYLSAVRLVAAAIGAEAGLSVDDLDDVRLGVNELVGTLIDNAAAGERVRLTFSASPNGVTVEGTLSGPGKGEPPDELSARIVAAVADDHEVGPTSFRFSKHLRQ